MSRETIEVLTIPGAWETVENWRTWLRALLSDAGFSNVREYEDGLIKANYWRIPFGDVAINTTEHLSWDGKSRTVGNEFVTGRYVTVEITANALWADPALLVDKIVRQVERADVNALSARPEVGRQSEPSSGGAAAKWKYIGVPAGLLALGLGIFGYSVIHAHNEQTAKERSYLAAAQDSGMSLDLNVRSDDYKRMGHDFCKGLDNHLSVDEAIEWLLPTQYNPENDRLVKLIVAYFAGTELCPEHSDEVKAWKVYQE